MILQLTDFAVGVLATDQSPLLDVFKIGSAFNYVPSPTDTDIHGSTLFTGTIATPVVLNANVVKYTISMDNSVGDFDWGEVGFFYQGQLFALAVGNSLQLKQKVGQASGNQVRLDAFLTVVGTNYDMIVDQADSSNQFQMASLSTIDQLPPSNQATPNAYIISGASAIQSSFIAYTDRNGLWNFDAFQYSSGAPATIVAADAQSVTINVSDFVSAMTPTYFGKVALEFTTGKLYSICRYVKTAVQSGSTVTLGFQTPLAVIPQVGDKITAYTRLSNSVTTEIPIATANILGGIKIGTGLTVQADGTCSIDPATLGAVTSVNGKTGGSSGAVTLTAADIPGLAIVAKTGDYNDLINKPAAYSLPIASLSTLGGVKLPSSGNLVVNASGVIDLGVAFVKTVNNVAPDALGNVQVTTSDIGLINPASVTSAADVNSYTTTGLFTVTSTVAATLSNAPSNADAATLEVVPLINGGTGDTIQRWTTANGMWWRARVAAVWSAWRQTAMQVIATTTTLGVVKIGNGLSVAGDGLVTANVRTVNGAGPDVSGDIVVPSDATKLNRVNGIATGIQLTFLDLGTQGLGASVSMSVTAANVQAATFTGGTITWTMSGWTSGVYTECQMELINAGLATHTFPAAVLWVNPDGSTTGSFAAYIAAQRPGTSNFQSSGTDFVCFWSRDGGITVYAKVM